MEQKYCPVCNKEHRSDSELCPVCLKAGYKKFQAWQVYAAKVEVYALDEGEVEDLAGEEEISISDYTYQGTLIQEKEEGLILETSMENGDCILTANYQ